MRNIETYCGLSFGYKIITTKQQQLSVQIVTQTYSYKSISKSRKMLPPPRLNAMKWLTLLAAIAAFCEYTFFIGTCEDTYGILNLCMCYCCISLFMRLASCPQSEENIEIVHTSSLPNSRHI